MSAKDTLRVSFIEQTTDLFESEIICLVRPYDAGLEIHYVQHIHRAREIPSEPWGEKRHRIPLSPILVATIQTGVMRELWSKFCMKVVFASQDLMASLNRHSGQ